jgi:sugar transferase (PEP-CTERM/EpsH1 system associated)
LAEILFLAHRIPYPPTKGDKIRAYQLLAHLARAHVVHLGCFVDDPSDWLHTEHLRSLCGECHFAARSRARAWGRGVGALARNEALSLAVLRDPGLARWIGDLVRRRPLSGIFAYSSAMAQFLTGTPAHGVQSIVDFVDVDSEKWRQIAPYARWPLSWLYRRESLRLAAFDRAAAARCDRCLFVSPAEAEAFQELIPEARGKVLVLRNGVDATFFSPALRFPCPLGPGGPLLAFTGDMSYWPNQDAVLWFAQAVLPRLRVDHPNLRFVAVGRWPGPRLRRSAARLGITLTGAVPDVRPFLAHAALVVAPLRIARGVPNKVLEAMAMGKAVVTTPAAVIGLQVRPGEDVLVAADAEGMASAVRHVLEPRFARSVGEKARARVVADYTWAPSLRLLDDLVAHFGPRPPPGRQPLNGSGITSPCACPRPLGSRRSRRSDRWSSAIGKHSR